MTDTVAILNTIRATFADSDPSKFDIGTWFDVDSGCGCIIGHSLTIQPMLERTLGLALRRDDEGDDDSLGLVNIFGEPRSLASGPESVTADLSATVGITEAEAHYLFDFSEYAGPVWRGPEGHAEALRRLDEVIARYTPAKVVERVTAAA